MDSKICLICKKKKFLLKSKIVRDSKKHQILICKNCGHHQIYPIPTLLQEKFFYDDNKQEKNLHVNPSIREIKKKYESDTTRRIEFVSKIIKKNNKILEVGSGYGLFLEGMKNIGYDITGIEISKEKRRISKKITQVEVLDVNIVNEKLNLPKVDVIVLFHVLEHIIEPVTFLKNLKKLLKTNGKIIVEVPNLADHQLKINKKYQEFYWQRAHIHYFKPKIFQKVFEDSGFNVKIKGVQRYSIENFINWKITGKPQLDNPTFSLSQEYEWIDSCYKKELIKSLHCDTIIAIAKKIIEVHFINKQYKQHIKN